MNPDEEIRLIQQSRREPAPAIFPHEQPGYVPPLIDPQEDAWMEHRVRAIKEDQAYYGPGDIPEPVIRGMDDVEEMPVTWIWEDRIPRGAITILDGHPGTGKSTITLDWIARVSTGRRMPDGGRGVRGNCLILSAEDSLERPIKARLTKAGADQSMVFGLEGVTDYEHPMGRHLTFPEDNRVLHRAIMQTDAQLVTIDPISAYFSKDINTGVDADVRRALTPLAHTAATTGAAIVIVRHQRKPDRTTAAKPSQFEGGGNVGGFGGARMHLQVMLDPEEEGVRTLWVVKSNFGIFPRPLDYCIEGGGRGTVAKIHWMP